MADPDDELIAMAAEARLRAVAPFSKFLVGAAVRTSTGRIFTGCNVESSSYGLTACAERIAIWKAVSEGERQVTRIAVVTDAVSLTPPCGACRQIIWEFGRDATVVLANLKGQREQLHITYLNPRPFDAHSGLN